MIIDYFNNIFTSTIPDSMDRVIESIEEKFSRQMNKYLIIPFTQEEVVLAISLMGH